MKTRIPVTIFLIHILALLIFFFLPYIFSSENKALAHTLTRRVYDPVYMSYEELRTPISSGSVQPLEEFGKIYLKDNFIFINELYKGVHVIENQDPSNPEAVAFIRIPGNVDISIRNNILYADSWIDLVAVDISNPTDVSEIKRIEGVFPNTGPTFLFMEELEENARFLEIDDSKGIVVDWEYVHTETCRHGHGGCFPTGTEILTADGPRNIETVDPGTEVYTCNPLNGEWILSRVRTQQTLNYEGDMITIYMDETKIKATGNHPFYVLSGDRLASRPLPQDIPKEDQGWIGSGRWVEARDLKKGDVLRSKSGKSMIVTNLSNGNEKTKVYHLEVEGNHNFAVHKTGILVHNKSADKSAAPSSTGKGGSLARFTIVDDYLYVLSGSELQLFEIKNPASPSVWERITIGWDIETIFPYKDKLFIGGQEGMYIYDNSDPANPIQISRFSHVTSCDPVVVEGKYAYVTLRIGTRCRRGANRLEIIDISDIYNPELIADYPMDGPYGLGIDRGLLFICDGEAGLKWFDASDPYNLKQIGGIPGIKTHDVILHNEIAMVVGQKGLYQYDYQDLENLELISEIGTQKSGIQISDFWNALSGKWINKGYSGNKTWYEPKLFVYPTGKLELYSYTTSTELKTSDLFLTIDEIWIDSDGVMWYKARRRDPVSHIPRDVRFVSYLDGVVDEVSVRDVALSEAAIQANMTQGLTGSETGLAAYWKCDEGEGQTVVDSTINGNDGYLGSDPGNPDSCDPTWIESNVNWGGSGEAEDYALEFDGADDYVETSLYNTGDTITVAAWVKIKGRTGYSQAIVCNFENSGWGFTYDYNAKNKFRWWVHINGSYHDVAADAEVQLNTWYYVVGTYDGDNGFLYVDGVKQSGSITENGLITDSPYKVILGANPNPGKEKVVILKEHYEVGMINKSRDKWEFILNSDTYPMEWDTGLGHRIYYRQD